MDRLAWMKSFVRAVETNSFSAVAREQQTTQPTISKHIAALEGYLGVQLLIRSTTYLSLTDEGKRFYTYCQHILETLAEAEANLQAPQNPVGILRVGCSVLFGQMQIVPRLQKFLAQYPAVKVNLQMADHHVDLVEEGLDVAIRIGGIEDDLLMAHRIGTTRRVTIATETYFKQAGIPQAPEDLQHHNCIVYTNLATGNEWCFLKQTDCIKVKVQGQFQTNSSVAVRAAVVSGMGIAIAPVWMFGDEIYQETLKIVLQDYEPTPMPIHAIYRRSRFISAKVQCFIRFLTDEFLQDQWVCP